MPIFRFLLGLFVGSFLNVLIYRLPRGEQFVTGRSRCVHCGHDLGIFDLIPVFSFLFLRGRCRYCHARISLRYPVIELLSGLIWAFAPGYLAIVILELCLIIAVIDFEHLIIPDVFVIAIALIALWNPHFFTALGFGGFFFALWAVSRGRWIGFGDIKLIAALGLFFGFPGMLIILYIAVIVGGLLGVFLLLLKRATRKTALPFGTLLCLSIAGFIFFQDSLLAVLHSWNLWW